MRPESYLYAVQLRFLSCVFHSLSMDCISFHLILFFRFCVVQSNAFDRTMDTCLSVCVCVCGGGGYAVSNAHRPPQLFNRFVEIRFVALCEVDL